MNETSNTTTTKNGTVTQKTFRKRVLSPAVDVYENSEEILVVADLPGVASQDLAVTMENDLLTLIARSGEGEDETRRALSLEYKSADYERVFRVPAGVDRDRITAEVKNGTVVIHMPKAEQAKPKLIPVKSG